tara:strand:+ start:1309 stop:1512 length:204 start_codon:yes stop_codon:yes gene_type:complete
MTHKEFIIKYYIRLKELQKELDERQEITRRLELVNGKKLLLTFKKGNPKIYEYKNDEGKIRFIKTQY